MKKSVMYGVLVNEGYRMPALTSAVTIPYMKAIKEGNCFHMKCNQSYKSPKPL